MKTAYDVLGVPRNASNERVRTAFRKAAKTHHPDLNAGDPSAEQQIKLVIAAYQILKTPRMRAAYDRYLGERRRERVRHFAMSAMASALRVSIVALALTLSVWPSNTQDASALPPTPQVSTKVRPDASQQVAAADNRGRQDVNRGRKDDRGAAPDRRPLHRPQTAGSLPATAGPPELYAALAREWLEASGEPMAFAGRAHESEPARSELVALIDAAPPFSNSPKQPSLEERATKFVSSRIAGWSSTSTGDLDSLARAYTDSVLYNGKRKSRQAILLQKSRELERWPERVYDVQPDSVTVQCSANVCKVRGIMAWQTRNAHRATQAGGISKFGYEITPSDNGFRILSESGSVVERYRQEDGRNHSRRIKVTAHQQRYKRPIASNETRSQGRSRRHTEQHQITELHAGHAHAEHAHAEQRTRGASAKRASRADITAPLAAVLNVSRRVLTLPAEAFGAATKGRAHARSDWTSSNNRRSASLFSTRSK